uniref:G protein-coupled receptor n=1 Tax=Pristionchus pacificus TaxID=54126 RepID=A0A8R1UVI8_PRIPA
MSLPVQNAILNAQRTLFCCSAIVNVIAFVCLIKETPANQKNFRNYLLHIQIVTAINDINLDVAVEPFPMFPAMGGFCKGIVCGWNVPIQYSFATTVLLLGNIGASIIICISYRHQALVRGRFKLSDVIDLIGRSIKIARIVIIVFYSSPGILGFSLHFDATHTEELIDNLLCDEMMFFKNRFFFYAYGNLTWIRQRGMYAFFVRTTGINVFLPVLTCIVLTFAIVLLFSMLGHIVWSINRDVQI